MDLSFFHNLNMKYSLFHFIHTTPECVHKFPTMKHKKKCHDLGIINVELLFFL